MKTIDPSFCALVALAASMSASAQDRDVSSIEDVSLEELLGGETSVASTKSMQLRASPGAITMITREEILRLGARDLADVLPFIPGLDLASDVSGVLGMSFRGNWAHEGKALVLVDGIEMHETHFLNVPLGGHFPLDDVARIEVLRGPGSARYGGSAELCVISIITRTGEQKKAAAVTGTYAQAERFGDNGSASGSVGTVINGIDVSLQASVAQMPRSDRVYDDLFGTSFDMSQQQSIRSAWVNAAVIAPWFKARLVIDGYSVDDRTGFAAAQTRSGPTGFPAAYLDLSSPWQLTPSLAFTARLVLQRQLPWWAFADDGVDFAARHVNDRGRTQLSLAWQALPGMLLSAGVDGFADAARDIPQETSGSRYLDFVDVRFSGEEVTNMYNGAVWGEALLETSLFVLTTGARAELHSVYGAAFVPRVALTRVFGPGHAKLLVSGAFKAPGIANLQLAPKIRPERTRVLEAEIGFELVPATYVTANVFDIEINDPIVYFFNEEDGTDNYGNFSRTGSRGVELQGLWSPRFGRFDVSWSFASSEGKNEVTAYAVPYDPSRMLAQPAHKVAATAAFFVTDKISFTPSIVVRSARAAVTSVDGSGASVITDLPASAMVNAFVDVRDLIEGVNFGVGIQNLLDEPFTVPQAYDSQHAPLPALDRTLMVRLGGSLALP